MIAALRTTLALALAVLACWLVPPVAGATAPSGAAAECEPLDLGNATAVRNAADAVTDVFAGKVRRVKPVTRATGGAGRPKGRKPSRKTTEWRQTVQLKASFSGERQSGDRVLVVTQPRSEDGLGRLELGGTYVFFVDEALTGRLTAEPCAGTQLLRGGLSSQQQQDLKVTLDESPADTPAPDVALTEPDDGTRATPDIGRLIAPGAAVTLIGVLGLLLLSRVGTRRP